MKRRLIGFVLLIVMFAGIISAMADERVISMELQGPMGERYDANLNNWLLTAPYHNPGMVQMYFRRNQPHQRLVPWYGEFAGKYLTSAVLCYRMQPNEKLADSIEYVIDQLYRAQDDDGYLGVWPDSQKLAGKTQAGDKTWDAWSHYHSLLGIYLWNKTTGSEKSAQIISKAIDCLHNFYVVNDNKMDEDKDGTDTAIAHICAILYKETGDERCMDIVKKAFSTFEAILGGDYYNAGLDNRPFYKMNRTRWECLHPIEAIKEMYDITGEESYKTSFANIWDGICRYDRHNTGGFSSGERACGNPYDLRAIETCCTVAWIALSKDMLFMSDNPVVADELELSTWNGLIGAQHANGRSFTYNTPMIGDKKASAHEIVFQAIAGSSELNCCSVNGPRGIGMIGEWGVISHGECITINYYGASKTQIETASGMKVVVKQAGAYPFGPDMKVSIAADEKWMGDVRLRIPFWSEKTTVLLNGKAIEHVIPGTYLTLRDVKAGDEVVIALDMSLHFWQGNYEVGGKTSLYYGPILLTCDQRFNNGNVDNLLPLRLSELALKPVECPDALYPAPYLLLEATDGTNSVTLCDFASAGQTGTTYTTWLATENELPVLRESGDTILWGQRITSE